MNKNARISQKTIFHLQSPWPISVIKRFQKYIKQDNNRSTTGHTTKQKPGTQAVKSTETCSDIMYSTYRMSIAAYHTYRKSLSLTYMF